MSPTPANRPPSAPEGLRRLRETVDARVRAELAHADALVPGSDVVPSAGDLYAAVLLVKGMPGPAEESGGAAVSGTDGDAAAKALRALGADADSVFRMLSRPVAGADEQACARRLRWTVEAVDPLSVVALDAVAAADCAAAFGLPDLRPGRAVQSLGRVFLYVDGLEASLADPARKRRVWEQFKALA